MSLMFKAWRMSDESVQVRKALEAIRNVCVTPGNSQTA